MVRVKCVGRRILEVSYLKDTDEFEMKIMIDGGVFPNRQIACPIIPAAEFEKLGVFFEMKFEDEDGLISNHSS